MKMEAFIKLALAMCFIGTASSQSCPENWELFEDRCYRFIPGGLFTWDSAQSGCSSLGGNLASISSLAQNDYIYDRMLQLNPLPELNNYWIGMFKDGAGLSYEWVDGSAVVFAAWAPGEPSDYSGVHNCVQVFADGELWDDTDCVTMNGAVCETDIVAACQSDDWDPYGDSCYRYYPDGLQTWDTAETMCTLQGAHLASVISEEDTLYLHYQMQAHNPLPEFRDYWIGLYRLGEGNNFGWMDGSAYSYQRWVPGNPNDDNGNQDCVYVETVGNAATEWNDFACDGSLLAYLCQMDKGSKRKEGKGDSLEQYNSINHLVGVAGQASENSINTDGLSTGATAGIVLGGLVAFVCVGTIVFMIMYRRKKMAKQTPPVISLDMTGSHI